MSRLLVTLAMVLACELTGHRYGAVYLDDGTTADRRSGLWCIIWDEPLGVKEASPAR